MVKTIIDVVSNGSKGILVDKKLIEGPNPNARFKMWLPLIMLAQVSFLTYKISLSCIDRLYTFKLFANRILRVSLNEQ